jgi:REP element-mobilizing transposase RayT
MTGDIMGERKLVIYYHLIWSTQEHNPWLLSDIERPVYRCIVDQIHKLGCEVIVINGVPDHIHLVVKMRSTIPLSLLVKQAKGVLSKFINDQMNINGDFRWSAGYGAFTISRWDLQMIIGYVKKQKTHHADGSLFDELE